MTRKPRVLAIHLPQFHPIPENDTWWGAGFTEWTNVARARALFPGHGQPRVPSDLGFYDLRLAEAREAQARLAREHGIDGFCHYHYWFNGRRLLDRPVRDILATQRPDFPFCLFWANETWSRRWTGEESEILVPQTYSEEDNIVHARHLAAVFSDRRHIRVAGRPLFLIYRPTHMDVLPHFLAELRAQCALAGTGDPLVLGCSAHAEATDMRTLGLDGTLDFQPKLGFLPGAFDEDEEARTRRNRELGVDAPGPRLYRADDLRAEMNRFRDNLPHAVYPSVFVSWDNTPRRGSDGIVLLPRSPASFRRGLHEALDYLDRRGRELAEPLLFLNAWNEWGEGNHLEPDLAEGRAYLAEVVSATAARRPRPAAGLPQWPADAEAILDRIAGPATLKLFVRVLEEPDMLRGWIEHHARIVGFENLIVADDGSRSPESAALYAEYADRINIFRFHDENRGMHANPVADRLYARLRATCAFFAFIDCDERLVMLSPDRWSADGEILGLLRHTAPHKIVPTTWLRHHVDSKDMFEISAGETYGGLEDGLKWGKPILPSAFIGLENGIHNLQHQGFPFAPREGHLLFLLHFCQFPAQRIEANRKKMLRYCSDFDPAWSVEEILKRGFADGADPTRHFARFIKEIAEMRDYLAGTRVPDRATHLLIAEDGTVRFSGPEAKAPVGAYFRDWPRLVRRILGGEAGSDPALARYAPSSAQLREISARCRALDLPAQVRLVEERGRRLHPDEDWPGAPQWRPRTARAGTDLRRLASEPGRETVAVLAPSTRARRALEHLPGAAGQTEARLGELEFAELQVIRLGNATIKGMDMVFVEGTPTFWEGIHPPYTTSMFPHGNARAAGDEVRETVRLGQSAAHLGHWTSHIYGHFLLEMLPKVTAFLELKELHPGLKLVVSDWAGAHVLGILRHFLREEDLCIYKHESQQVEAPDLFLLPGLFTDRALHPAMGRFLDLAHSKAARNRPAPPRIFISKSRWRSSHRHDYRRLDNEDEVRAWLEKRGFVTVFPEELPWAEQIALFAGAKIVVGEYGSALHNAIFSPPGTVVIGLNRINEVQDCIASYAGHRIGYVLPSDGVPRLHGAKGTAPGFRIRLDELADLLAFAS
jgi:capsular polysaccharide biosynthesis protein